MQNLYSDTFIKYLEPRTLAHSTMTWKITKLSYFHTDYRIKFSIFDTYITVFLETFWFIHISAFWKVPNVHETNQKDLKTFLWTRTRTFSVWTIKLLKCCTVLHNLLLRVLWSKYNILASFPLISKVSDHKKVAFIVLSVFLPLEKMSLVHRKNFV